MFIIGIIGYVTYDYFVGNHVQIQSVLGQSHEGAATISSTMDEAIPTEWRIGEDSSVFFSVTTSKEKVNIEASEVTGNWIIPDRTGAYTEAAATVQLDSIDSGNSKRDGHIKESEYLDVAQFPEATFELTELSGWTEELRLNQLFEFSVVGDLTIRGETNETEFTMKGIWDGASIRLDGLASIVFDDFGVKKPDSVISSMDEEIELSLQLVLEPVDQDESAEAAG